METLRPKTVHLVSSFLGCWDRGFVCGTQKQKGTRRAPLGRIIVSVNSSKINEHQADGAAARILKKRREKGRNVARWGLLICLSDSLSVHMSQQNYGYMVVNSHKCYSVLAKNHRPCPRLLSDNVARLRPTTMCFFWRQFPALIQYINLFFLGDSYMCFFWVFKQMFDTSLAAFIKKKKEKQGYCAPTIFFFNCATKIGTGNLTKPAPVLPTGTWNLRSYKNTQIFMNNTRFFRSQKNSAKIKIKKYSGIN